MLRICSVRPNTDFNLPLILAMGPRGHSNPIYDFHLQPECSRSDVLNGQAAKHFDWSCAEHKGQEHQSKLQCVLYYRLCQGRKKRNHYVLLGLIHCETSETVGAQVLIQFVDKTKYLKAEL